MTVFSKTFKYTVDGEKVTIDEIYARCPNVSKATLYNRVRLGWRTWKELQMPAQTKAQALARNKAKKEAKRVLAAE